MRVLSLLLVTSLVAVSSTVAAASHAGGSRTVTLVTGDQVRIRSIDRVAVKPASGREKIRFLTNRIGDGLEIIPLDQLDDIAGGRVDRRQFQVISGTTKPVATAQTHALTLTHVDRLGSPATWYQTTVVNRDTYESDYVTGPSDTGTLYLPAGRYVATSVMWTGDPDRPEITMLTIPLLILDSDQSYTLDGRSAQLISISLPDPAVKPMFLDVSWEIRINRELALGHSVGGGSGDPIYVGHAGSGAGNPEFMAKVIGQWADPGPTGDFTNSPLGYNLAWYQEGKFFTGLKKVVQPQELATIKARHHSHLAGGQGLRGLWPVVPGKAEWGVASEVYFDLPFSRTEYVNNDLGRVQWHIETGDSVGVAYLDRLANFQPGVTYQQTWNNAVFSPGVGGTRNGNDLSMFIPMYTDGSGHPGDGIAHTIRTTLSHDGVPYYQAPNFYPINITLPGEEIAWRLEIEASRGEPWPYDLSSYIKVAWTFRSRYTPSAEPIPMSAVRFSPVLDSFNTAPGGTRFTVPVSVTRQGGGSTRRLVVEVSYDSGLTWQRAILLPTSAGWKALLRHPSGSGLVSLRAKHLDTQGNTMELTVIGAYRYRS